MYIAATIGMAVISTPLKTADSTAWLHYILSMDRCVRLPYGYTISRG